MAIGVTMCHLSRGKRETLFQTKGIMHACVRGIMPIQSRKGGIDFPVYRGVSSRQYGHGLGSNFKEALRTAAPILKPMTKIGLQSAKKVTKEHGIQALKEIASGQNVKQVLKQRGKTALKSFGQSTFDQLFSGINSTRKPNKTQSKSNRQTVQKAKRFFFFLRNILDFHQII